MGEEQAQTPAKQAGRKKWCRRLLIVGLLLGLSPFILWFTAGWWFPPLLQFSLRWTPAAAETVTYLPDGRLQLTGVHYAANGTEARVGQLHLPAPGQMIGAWLRGNRLPDVTIESWQLDISPAAEAPDEVPAEAPEPGEVHIPETLTHWIGLLQQWRWLIPSVTLRSGLVTVAGEMITVDEITWRDATLRLAAGSDDWPSPVTARITVNADDSIDSTVELSSLNLELGTRIAVDANSAALDTTLRWIDNVAQVAVEWPRQGILPSSVTIDIPDLTIPADMLKLDGYQQPTITATASGTLSAYSATVHISAQPDEGQALPPLKLELDTSGSGDQLQIHNIAIEGDFVQGTLSSPISFDFARPDQLSAAQFDFAADLDRQEILPLKGKIHGKIAIPGHTLGDGGVPVVTIELAAAALQWKSVMIDTLEARVRLDWPTLEIEALTIRSAAATADVSATVNIIEQAIADGVFAIEVTPEIAAFLPDDSLPLPFDSARLEGKVSGTLEDLQHTGSAHIEALELPTVGSGSVTATWEGTATAVTGDIEAAFENLKAATRLTVSQPTGTEWLAHIETANIQPTGADALTLAEPVEVRIDTNAGAGASSSEALIPFTASITPLTLLRATDESALEHGPNQIQIGSFRSLRHSCRGTSSMSNTPVTALQNIIRGQECPPLLSAQTVPGSPTASAAHRPQEPPTLLSGDSSPVLSLHIPHISPTSGDLSLRINGLRGSDAGVLLELPAQLLTAEIQTLDLALQWDSGPLSGTLLLAAAAEVEDLPPLAANLALTIEDQAIDLSNVSIAQDGKTALSGTARLPITLSLVDADLITIHPAAPLSADFSSDPDARAWATVEQLTGARITQPRLTINLSGSAQSPRGEVRFDAATISPPDLDLPVEVSIDDLHLSLLIQPDGLNLEALTFTLLDHPFTASGRWPISQRQWIELLNAGTLPPHASAHADVAFTNFRLKRFADLLPDIVRPQGMVSATLSYSGSDGLTGSATIRDVATFPLPSIGAITNIRGDITITDHTLSIDTFTAQIGGEKLRLNGTVDVEDLGKPRLDLHATAQNLPLLRSPGLIMRAEDIEIHITTAAADITTLSGTIRMAESFLLVDFNDLRSSTTSADNPPPFFSVEDEPFANWALDVKIIGDRFLRVSTPIFDGVISADFTLGGNLGAPVSHGIAFVQRGFIKFPFALFTVSQGEIAIDPSSPYTIRLNLDASGRSYGYDLRMQVTGTAADPVLQFSSTPTLENADILLLVTAGRIPQGGTEMSSSSRLSGLGLFLGSTFLAELGLVDPYSDRLRIRLGEDVSAAGRDTIQVEFRINEKASIIGEYDRFDAYNLDFKYLIFSRQ